jgi:hypothetical protein
MGIEQQVVGVEVDDVNQLLKVWMFFYFLHLKVCPSLVEAQASGIHSVISDGVPKKLF